MGFQDIVDEVEANKPFTMYGKKYLPGDPVDSSMLSAHKVGQLLSHRILRPSARALGKRSADAGPA